MVLSMDRWVGKVAIVTGATSSIGDGITEKLVEHGLNVVGIARRKERLEQLSQKLSDKKGKFYPLQGDKSKEEDILNAFKWIKENLGPIHILVNNSGVIRRGSLTEAPTEAWEEVINTNVLGLCIATREAIKDMKDNNVDGHIIHINSIAGHQVPNVSGMNVYPASKFMVTALAETLRLELNALKSKIKITSLSPGAVYNGNIIRCNVSYWLKKMERNKEILKPEDIADGVVYVLSTPPHVQIPQLTIRPVFENY